VIIEKNSTQSGLGPMFQVPRKCITAFCTRNQHFFLKLWDEFAKVIVVLLGQFSLSLQCHMIFISVHAGCDIFRVTGIG
jgi:hypothetical protein